MVVVVVVGGGLVFESVVVEHWQLQWQTGEFVSDDVFESRTVEDGEQRPE